MPLRTECPRCVTVFHVTPEQLREAQGWVRCGICQEVFAAHAHALSNLAEVPTDEPLALRQENVPSDPSGLVAPAPTSRTQARRPKRVPSERSRRVGWIAVMVLAIFLLAQLGIVKRHLLAAHFPHVAGWLQSACGGEEFCSLRSIQGVAIEESNFDAIDASHFRLSAVVSNRAVFDLQAPSFVLALTDSTDRVVAKKLFGPREWGAQASTLATRTAWPIVLWIQIDVPPNSSPVVGYRLTAFYP